jgi:hypothetical protein
MVSSYEDGFAGGVGDPVQAASPVSRYVRRWRRDSRRCRVEEAVFVGSIAAISGVLGSEGGGVERVLEAVEAFRKSWRKCNLRGCWVWLSRCLGEVGVYGEKTEIRWSWGWSGAGWRACCVAWRSRELSPRPSKL